MFLHSLSLWSHSSPAKAGVQSKEKSLGSCLRRSTVRLSRLFDLQQMLHLPDLAEHFGRALNLDRAVQLVQAQADERRALGLVAADRRSGLRDPDLGHALYSVTASAWASASAVL